MLDDSPSLVIPAFRANRVGRDGNIALWAIANLTLLDAVVGASFACTAVGVFSLGNSHRCNRPVCIWSGFLEPRIVEVKGGFRQRSQAFVFEKPGKYGLLSLLTPVTIAIWKLAGAGRAVNLVPFTGIHLVPGFHPNGHAHVDSAGRQKSELDVLQSQGFELLLGLLKRSHVATTGTQFQSQGFNAFGKVWLGRSSEQIDDDDPTARFGRLDRA